MLELKPDVLVDAIDQPKNKCLLIDESRKANIDVLQLVVQAAVDPTKVQVADLSRAYNDKLSKRVRKSMRQDFGWPRGDKRWKVPAVFSSELPSFQPTRERSADTASQEGPVKLDCASGFGAATFLTGTFGFFAAHLAIAQILRRHNI